MNKTKKLTQGAMMLAIMGALILIDRLIAYAFTELVILIAPIIIIMYSAMQSFKDGCLLSIGVLIISFLLGNFQLIYLIYIPVGIVTGLVYSYALIKGMNKSTLLFLSCVTYIIGEIVASYVIYPLLGFPVAQMIEEFKVSMSAADSLMGVSYADVFKASGLDVDKAFIAIYLIATIITGALEGILIHVLVIFLLKRFKIKDLGRMNIFDIKPNKVVSYISFLSLFTFFFRNKITNETLYYILFVIALIGGFILIYYGYLFITLYGVIVLRRNIATLFVILALFVPVLLVVLIILGFLYGAGPLRSLLEDRMNKLKHE